MKAKIAPKKDPNNRTRLETVIPLRTPYSIFIEPSDKCNFRCKFCPTGDLELIKKTEGRNYGNIDFDLCKKVIDDISDFEDNIKLLQLYKDGEPLLNKKMPDIISYAKKSNKFNIISTTTNGYLLNEELSLNLVESGLNRINISIEGINEEQYLKISNVKIDFNKLIKNIEFLYKNKKQLEINIKTVGNTLTEKEKNDFYNIFGNICDNIFIENIVSSWGNFSFNKDELNFDDKLSLYGNDIRNEVIVCPLIFYAIAVNSNGSVSPCCNDWQRKVIIGNAKTEKIKDIWNGKKLMDLQIMHLKNQRRNHPLCSTCELPKYGTTDNIDDYRDELLNKIILAEQSRAEQIRA